MIFCRNKAKSWIKLKLIPESTVLKKQNPIREQKESVYQTPNEKMMNGLRRQLTMQTKLSSQSLNLNIIN